MALPPLPPDQQLHGDTLSYLLSDQDWDDLLSQVATHLQELVAQFRQRRNGPIHQSLIDGCASLLKALNSSLSRKRSPYRLRRLCYTPEYFAFEKRIRF